MKVILSSVVFLALGASLSAQTIDEVPVFITIGQSNADGSAYFDPAEDARLLEWYSSPANKGKMKIWYRSSQVKNTKNQLGEAARHVIDGKVTDAGPGWMNLWYRNENKDGRTAMNMIHGYGTYSTGTGRDCAQGRRGMEGQFGLRWAEANPDQELYIVKLGASGSFISAWADPQDDTNWNYFVENIYEPAIADLLAQGKKPRLAGAWWMQGCADNARDSAYYAPHLREVVRRVREDLGFKDATVYVGHIVKPGENPDIPKASVQFGQGVRDAQDAVAAADPNVVIIDTRTFPIQDDNLHFNHQGVNAIGNALADNVLERGWDNWTPFSTPGTWTTVLGQPVFTPTLSIGSITYETVNGNTVAVVDYGGWTDRVPAPKK